jgi:hypothetical protein
MMERQTTVCAVGDENRKDGGFSATAFFLKKLLQTFYRSRDNIQCGGGRTL